MCNGHCQCKRHEFDVMAFVARIITVIGLCLCVFKCWEARTVESWVISVVFVATVFSINHALVVQVKRELA